MDTMTRPTAGMRFVHTGYVRGEHEPECIITRVTDTSVYYRTARDRSASCDLLVFGGKVKTLVVPGSELPPLVPASWREVLFSNPE